MPSSNSFWVQDAMNRLPVTVQDASGASSQSQAHAGMLRLLRSGQIMLLPQAGAAGRNGQPRQPIEPAGVCLPQCLPISVPSSACHPHPHRTSASLLTSVPPNHPYLVVSLICPWNLAGPQISRHATCSHLPHPPDPCTCLPAYAHVAVRAGAAAAVRVGTSGYFAPAGRCGSCSQCSHRPRPGHPALCPLQKTSCLYCPHQPCGSHNCSTRSSSK